MGVKNLSKKKNLKKKTSKQQKPVIGCVLSVQLGRINSPGTAETETSLRGSFQTNVREQGGVACCEGSGNGSCGGSGSGISLRETQLQSISFLYPFFFTYALRTHSACLNIGAVTRGFKVGSKSRARVLDVPPKVSLSLSPSFGSNIIKDLLGTIGHFFNFSLMGFKWQHGRGKLLHSATKKKYQKMPHTPEPFADKFAFLCV